MTPHGIILLGLGPGDSALLTRQAWEVLSVASEVYLRTRQHPAVAGFPAGLRVYSFDHLYERGESFEEVYAQIVEQVMELGRRPQGVVYAVPGHPFVAEATAPEIARRARAAGIPLRIVEGISFLEAVFFALSIDPFPHTALIDALELAVAHHPPFPPSAPALVAQIHSRAVASDVKLTLMEVYPDEHSVQLVHGAGMAECRVESLPLYEIDRSPHVGLLTSLYVPPLGQDTSFEAFQELVAHLRAPEGCPWDREQNHQTLRPHLLEEAYETLAALDADDPQAMCEEFGDLLLQIVLHTQIANEYGEFSMSDVIQGIHSKLVRRHPHVFGDLKLDDQQGILRNWERLKAAEREANGKSEKSLLDGVAVALPALVQAEEYQKRAARVGFNGSDVTPLQKGSFTTEVAEYAGSQFGDIERASDPAERAAAIGDLLFAVVNLARRCEVDAESALREANARFRQQVAQFEAARKLKNWYESTEKTNR